MLVSILFVIIALLISYYFAFIYYGKLVLKINDFEKRFHENTDNISDYDTYIKLINLYEGFRCRKVKKINIEYCVVFERVRLVLLNKEQMSFNFIYKEFWDMGALFKENFLDSIDNNTNLSIKQKIDLLLKLGSNCGFDCLINLPYEEGFDYQVCITLQDGENKVVSLSSYWMFNYVIKYKKVTEKYYGIFID